MEELFIFLGLLSLGIIEFLMILNLKHEIELIKGCICVLATEIDSKHVKVVKGGSDDT